MTLGRVPRLFGSQTRTQLLIAIRLLGETYPTELATLLGVRLYSVQRALESLEGESVLVSRQLGRTRRICLNPRYFAHRELDGLLWKLGEHDAQLQKALATGRRRSRRPGKPGL